jgi:hypothetical protein
MLSSFDDVETSSADIDAHPPRAMALRRDGAMTAEWDIKISLYLHRTA